MIKKIAILYSKYTCVIDAIIAKLTDIKVETFNFIPTNIGDYDLIINVNYDFEIDYNCLKLHYSLLPAFEDEKEPIREAFLLGVKVTGFTIFYTKTREIVVQYPIFINNLAHYDEIVLELEYLAQTIFPIVVQKIVNNEIFDIKTLIKSSHKCGGCSSCKK